MQSAEINFDENSNIDKLRRELMRTFKELKDGTADLKTAVELNNTAGKIINIAKVQLAYHALRGEAPNIPFLATLVDKPGYLLPPIKPPMTKNTADSAPDDVPDLPAISSRNPWPGAVTTHALKDDDDAHAKARRRLRDAKNRKRLDTTNA